MCVWKPNILVFANHKSFQWFCSIKKVSTRPPEEHSFYCKETRASVCRMELPDFHKITIHEKSWKCTTHSENPCYGWGSTSGNKGSTKGNLNTSGRSSRHQTQPWTALLFPRGQSGRIQRTGTPRCHAHMRKRKRLVFASRASFPLGGAVVIP